MQFNYPSRYLIVINENAYVSVYKYEKYKFDHIQTFLSFQAKNFLMASQGSVRWQNVLEL